MMRIGIPKEVKPEEGRVALIPRDCEELLQAGHEVLLERSAGLASGYSDEAYSELGVIICSDAAELFSSARLIVKVRSPMAVI
jgi:alanine dehydrogenase